MSSFINKSTKKAVPRLPGFRRRPLDASARSSTEPQVSPAPGKALTIPTSSSQQEDALSTPPTNHPSHSEPSQATTELPITTSLALQTTEDTHGRVQEDQQPAAHSHPPQRPELQGRDEPPSKRRKTTPPNLQAAEESSSADSQDEAVHQSDEPALVREPPQPALVRRPEPHRTLDTAVGAQTTDRTVANGWSVSDQQSLDRSPQFRTQQDGAQDKGEISRVKKLARSKPKPPIPTQSPPLGGTIMRTIEGPEEPVPPARPRKVRKDKGTKRDKKRQAAEADTNEAQNNASTGLLEGDRGTRGSGVSASEERSELSLASATVPSAPNGDSQLPKSRSHTAPSSFTPATSVEVGNALGDAGRPRKHKRKRRKTPPENEQVEITPSITTMHDLCKDTRTGRTSTKEKRLQAKDWAETAQQPQAAQDRFRSLSFAGQGARNLRASASLNMHHGDGARSRSRSRSRNYTAASQDDADIEDNVHQGPTLRLVDGVIQVDEASLQVDRHAAQNGDLDPATTAIEEDDLSQRLTAQSWLYANRRDPADRISNSHKGDPWDAGETRLFYEALRMFGTDFEIISAMFPGRNRKQIKSKFTREERENPDLVDEALGIEGRVPMNLEQYAHATGRDGADGDEVQDDGGEGRGFVDPVKLKEELAREEEEARKQIEELRKGAAEEMRQREAAKLHRNGDGENGGREGADANKDNSGRKKLNKKRKNKSDRKTGKRTKPAVVAGGEEVVVESVEV